MLSIYYQVIMFIFTVLQSYIGFKIMPWPKEGFKDINEAVLNHSQDNFYFIIIHHFN